MPKIKWPDLKFPGINLWNVWPSMEMLALQKELDTKFEFSNQTQNNDQQSTHHNRSTFN